MKYLVMSLLVVVFSTTVCAGSKPKIAVMELEDKSSVFDNGVIEQATEYLR